MIVESIPFLNDVCRLTELRAGKQLLIAAAKYAMVLGKSSNYRAGLKVTRAGGWAG